MIFRFVIFSPLFLDKMDIVSPGLVRYNLATIRNGGGCNAPTPAGMRGCRGNAGFMQGGTFL